MARGLSLILAIALSITYLVCLAVTNVHGDTALHVALGFGPAVGASVAVAVMRF